MPITAPEQPRWRVTHAGEWIPMAESTMSPTAEAAAPAPAPTPLRLNVVSNGDPAGTRLVDEQGNAVTFAGCHGRLDLRAEAGKGVAQLVLVFPDIPVHLEGTPPPFILLGVVTGGDRPGPLPVGVTMAPPILPPHAAPTHPLTPAVHPAAHPTTGQALRQVRQMNEGY